MYATKRAIPYAIENFIKEELKRRQKMEITEIQKKTVEFVKNLINNSKNEEDKDIENEKVDKRKLIDEVAGIMKSGGCDDELIRTAIGKMEKIGYDDSEADTADNKKDVKNEDKDDDEEKVEEFDKKIKKDVDNKCDKKDKVNNSKTDYYGKMNEIYNAAKAYKEESTYISRADRLKAGEEYFALNSDKE